MICGITPGHIVQVASTMPILPTLIESFDKLVDEIG
jgi:hypothetical protein